MIYFTLKDKYTADLDFIVNEGIVMVKSERYGIKRKHNIYDLITIFRTLFKKDNHSYGFYLYKGDLCFEGLCITPHSDYLIEQILERLYLIKDNT